MFYIHGSIEDNNMLLGYDDIDGTTDDILFKKYYKRLIKNTDIFKIPWEIDGYGGFVEPEVYFFGHSLDISDGENIDLIVSQCNKIHIYYMNETDRSRKILNLIKILGKEKTKQRIEDGRIKFEIIPCDT